jgi:hypothetical protein
MSNPFEGSEADKFESAWKKKGKGGLGFSKENENTNKSSNENNNYNNSGFNPADYLAKYGWSAGSSLGKSSTSGLKSYLKIAKKDNNEGIGSSKNKNLNKSFENIFNQAASKLNIIIHDSDHEEEQESKTINNSKDNNNSVDSNSDNSHKKSKDGKEKKSKKKNKKCQENSEQNEISQSNGDSAGFIQNSTADPSNLSSTSKQLLYSNFTRASHITLEKSEISRIEEIKTTSIYSIKSNLDPTSLVDLNTIGDKLLEFDEERSHLYHDRVAGKLKRVQQQEYNAQTIIENIRQPLKRKKHLIEQTLDKPIFEVTNNINNTQENAAEDNNEELSKEERKRAKKTRKEAKKQKKQKE